MEEGGVVDTVDDRACVGEAGAGATATWAVLTGVTGAGAVDVAASCGGGVEGRAMGSDAASGLVSAETGTGAAIDSDSFAELGTGSAGVTSFTISGAAG